MSGELDTRRMVIQRILNDQAGCRQDLEDAKREYKAATMANVRFPAQQTMILCLRRLAQLELELQHWAE